MSAAEQESPPPFPLFAPPPYGPARAPRGLPSDAQRASLERYRQGVGPHFKLSPPSRTLGMVTIEERRAPKRAVAILDVAGRRIHYVHGEGWRLRPWKFDP